MCHQVVVGESTISLCTIMVVSPPLADSNLDVLIVVALKPVDHATEYWGWS